MQNVPFAMPRTLTVGERSYQIHPLTVDDTMVDLQAWVDQQFPDPFDVVNEQIERGRLVTNARGEPDREPYPMIVQQFMLKSAIDTANSGKRLVGTPTADAKLASAAGVAEQIYLSIHKGDPAFTRAQAAELFDLLSVAQVSAVFTATNLAEVISDPKAEPIAGTATA
jgi:hypothetical protein